MALNHRDLECELYYNPGRYIVSISGHLYNLHSKNFPSTSTVIVCILVISIYDQAERNTLPCNWCSSIRKK